jgi:hypothetical protein
VAN